MPKHSVLGKPSAVQGGAPLNGFPMSQNYTFTAAAGMLLPTYKQFLNYGEKVKGLPKAFIRTEPLLAPAMADLDVYCDVFFVPMKHMISMYDAWFVQVDDNPSALWSPSSWKEHLPVVNKNVGEGDGSPNAFGWMNYTIFETSQVTRRFVQNGDDTKYTYFGFGAHRLAQMLGYNAQAMFHSVYIDPDWSVSAGNIMPEMRQASLNVNQPAFCPYYFMAYQKIYYDYYRDSNLEPNNVKAYNIDDEMNAGNVAFYPTAANDARLGMFALRYRMRSKDYFTHIHPNPFFNTIGMLPNAKYNLQRLNNWLTEQVPNIYERGANGDSVYINTYTGGSLVAGDTDFVSDFDTKRWTQFDGSSPLQGDLQVTTDGNIRDKTNFRQLKHDHPIDFASAIENDYLGFQGSGDQGISLAQVRAAFALDKLFRLSNRAGKHADDQILAQFGVRIPQGISGEVYKIKSYHTLFHIGEVIQTANTVNSSGDDIPLGEMAGRGVAILNGDEQFSFEAPCSGVLMCIMSIAPRYKYAFTTEKDGMKVYIEDFFKPSGDNLGMQPLFLYEANETGNSSYRWQYRYMEDKLKFDKVSMVFGTTSKNPWSFCARPTGSPYFGDTFPLGSEYTDLKVMPFDTNNMFVVQYEPCPFYPGHGSSDSPLYTASPALFLSWYLRDPFTVDFNMTCTKVSQMSTYGEPELGGI